MNYNIYFKLKISELEFIASSSISSSSTLLLFADNSYISDLLLCVVSIIAFVKLIASITNSALIQLKIPITIIKKPLNITPPPKNTPGMKIGPIIFYYIYI